MLRQISTVDWDLDTHAAWTRRAYGRQVMLEGEGGTLSAAFDADRIPDQLYLRLHVEGRMLIRLRTGRAELLSELVSNEELDRFIDLTPLQTAGKAVRLELQIIPATFGTVRIPEEIDLLGATLPKGQPQSQRCATQLA